jgi:hypothetical protein
MKTLDEARKAMAQALSRAYGVSVWPVEIDTTRTGEDARRFIAKTAGRPHKDLSVFEVGGLAIARADRMSADEALASTLADLMDGGVSLDRQAAAFRGLGELVERHRRTRARANPLPSDLMAKARAQAPSVIRRGGGSAVRVEAKPPPPPLTPPVVARAPLPARAPVKSVSRSASSTARTAVVVRRDVGPKVARVESGSRVTYRRLDDDSEHRVQIGAASAPPGVRAIPVGSPLASALLGATTGTVVSATIGGEAVELEVLTLE